MEIPNGYEYDNNFRVSHACFAGTRAPVPVADIEATARERVDARSAARSRGSMRRWSACRARGTSGDPGDGTRGPGAGRRRPASAIRAVPGRRRQPGGPRSPIPKGSSLCSRYHISSLSFSLFLFSSFPNSPHSLLCKDACFMKDYYTYIGCGRNMSLNFEIV